MSVVATGPEKDENDLEADLLALELAIFVIPDGPRLHVLREADRAVADWTSQHRPHLIGGRYANLQRRDLADRCGTPEVENGRCPAGRQRP